MKTVENTQSWPLHKIAPYGPPITAALKRLVTRFPDDVTLESLREKLFTGTCQLWLMLDDGKFCACAFTEIHTVDATGNRFVLLTDMAGEFGPDDLQFFPIVQKWAAEQGVEEIRFVGRVGWKRMLKKIGFDPHIVYYRKVA